MIDALVASRIPIQFVGQIATVFYLRSRSNGPPRPTFRMPLFPLPADRGARRMAVYLRDFRAAGVILYSVRFAHGGRGCVLRSGMIAAQRLRLGGRRRWFACVRNRAVSNIGILKILTGRMRLRRARRPISPVGIVRSRLSFS